MESRTPVEAVEPSASESPASRLPASESSASVSSALVRLLPVVLIVLASLFLFDSQGLWMLILATMLLGVANVVLASRYPPDSSADDGSVIDPTRALVATGLVWLAAAGLASQSGPMALVGLVAVGLWRLWPPYAQESPVRTPHSRQAREEP
jgi:drug/metabolite transporter (DMT)-like permease